jgi:hypothetical protein
MATAARGATCVNGRASQMAQQAVESATMAPA